MGYQVPVIQVIKNKEVPGNIGDLIGKFMKEFFLSSNMSDTVQ
jgi:hypothetical protein